MKTDKLDREWVLGLLQELCGAFEPSLGTYSPQFDVFPSAITLPIDSYLDQTAGNIEVCFQSINSGSMRN